MADLSNHGTQRHVPFRTHLADSFASLVHLLSLLGQAWMREGTRSIEAKLRSGEHVSLAGGFRLDGTTFIVTRDDGTPRRVPASSIEQIVDKGDYGYF